jgi:hypothetical protein
MVQPVSVLRSPVRILTGTLAFLAKGLNITITILDIVHRPVFYLKTRRFGNWIIFSPEVDPTQDVPNRKSCSLSSNTNNNASIVYKAKGINSSP